MENKKLVHIHKHLALVFTGVTFCIILTIAGSFLATRYFNELRIQKTKILSQVSSIVHGIESDSNFLQDFQLRNNEVHQKKLKLEDMRGNQEGKSQISFFVLDAQENLIFQQQLQTPHFTLIDFGTREIYKNNGSFVVTRQVDDLSIIFYQDIHYQGEDVLRDLLLLFILVSLISGGIYYVGYGFVARVLIPVEENMKDMSDFTHNAGHELKTPLAVIRGNLQILTAEKKLDKELAKKTILQVDEMTGLIDGLRELSELGKVAERVSINIPKETEKIVKDLESLAYEQEVKLHGKFPEKFMIYANKHELDIFLSNILKNAIIYNSKGGEVFISMQKNILIVRDTGVGISQKDIEKIFDRLYRVDNSRNSKGFGIGLSLVKKIADANNWKISVNSKVGEGTSFEVMF